MGDNGCVTDKDCGKHAFCAHIDPYPGECLPVDDSDLTRNIIIGSIVVFSIALIAVGICVFVKLRNRGANSSNMSNPSSRG
ncbi:unnamed protein product [Caenorhabditis angaria]|uniref:Uncharacterized protein n=1 Tax=Caenorhabditis angaria TaxID=860376 RepID=A0A9P1IMI0_9PELO|nr:unnamed protein product [Caenorhabditis angaria]